MLLLVSQIGLHLSRKVLFLLLLLLHGQVLLLLLIVGHLLVVLLLLRSCCATTVFITKGIFVQLRHNAHQLLLSLLEIGLFALIYLPVDAVDLKFIRLYLRLVILELTHHFLELLAALFKVLLIDNQLF